MGRRRRSNPFSLFSFQDIITSVMGILLLSALLLAVELITRKPTVSSDARLEAAHRGISNSIETMRADLARFTKELESATANAAAVAADLVADAPQRKVAALDRIDRLTIDLDALQKAIDTSRKEASALEATQFDRRGDRDRLEAMTHETGDIAARLEAIRNSKQVFFREAPGSNKTAWVVDLDLPNIRLGRLASNAGVPPASIHSFVDVASLLKHVRSMSPNENYFLIMVRPSGVLHYDEVVDALRKQGYQLGFDVLSEDQVIFAEEG